MVGLAKPKAEETRYVGYGFAGGAIWHLATMGFAWTAPAAFIQRRGLILAAVNLQSERVAALRQAHVSKAR
jgi:hypothetical protein